MEFFIKIDNGQPVGHPTDIGSVLALHPEGVPEIYQRFVPTPPPEDLGPYETHDGQPAYAFNGEYWYHEYNRRSMTEAEKAGLIERVQASWEVSGFPSWTFLEEECRYVPPVQPPTDDAVYHWDEEKQEWLEGPAEVPEVGLEQAG